MKAGGDATGHEILRTLIAAIKTSAHITMVEEITADDLIVASGRVVGVSAHANATGEHIVYAAPAMILATGGIGRLFRSTTNPVEATGDGVAMAARAGATLADMEFVQFHPTALAIGADPMPLVTEAIRGEGATLLNDLGERFMLAIAPDAELAPRDVVARAIFEQLQRGRVVGLDASVAIGDAFPKQFPTVFSFCREAGIDPRSQRIPVAPAEHYHMGGIAVDEWGESSMPGLYACGETSATGVHGANRLASNSLLEALVYGARVAERIREKNESPPQKIDVPEALPRDPRLHTQAVRDLRNVMYANVGLMRNELGLREALARIGNLERTFATATNELRNLLVVGRLIAQAALDRRESRGSHYRSDFPNTDEELAKRSFTHL